MDWTFRYLGHMLGDVYSVSKRGAIKPWAGKFYHMLSHNPFIDSLSLLLELFPRRQDDIVNKPHGGPFAKP